MKDNWQRFSGMNSQTVTTLTALGWSMALIGAMVPAPLARLTLTGLGFALAFVPLRWGNKRQRGVGILLIVVALWLAFDAYPDARTEASRYGGQANRR